MQDSWTLKRLDVESRRAVRVLQRVDQRDGGRGRPLRRLPLVSGAGRTCRAGSTSRRGLGVVYDLTGDAKTAIRFGDQQVRHDVRRERDVAVRPDGAQERHPQLVRLRVPAEYVDLRPGPDRCARVSRQHRAGQRNRSGRHAVREQPLRGPEEETRLQHSVQRRRRSAVGSGFRVGFAWFRRSWYNLPISINQLVGITDYTSFETTNPLTNKTMTLYNLNPAKAGQSLILDTTSTDHSKTRRDYTGVRAERDRPLAARRDADRWVGRRSHDQRDVRKSRSEPAATTAIKASSTFRFAATSSSSAPIQSRTACRSGAVLQSYAGAAVPVSWSVPATVFPGRQTHAGGHAVDNSGRYWLHGLEPERSRLHVSPSLESAGLQPAAGLQGPACQRGRKPRHFQLDELQRRAQPESGIRHLAGRAAEYSSAEAVTDFEHAQVLIDRVRRLRAAGRNCRRILIATLIAVGTIAPGRKQ